MNSKQRKQYKKMWIKSGIRLADWFDKIANDDSKTEVLTKTDLQMIAIEIRKIVTT